MPRKSRLRPYNRRVQTRWWTYVQDVVNGAPNIEVAHRVGIDNSALTRWKNGQDPGVKFVVKFARAYSRNVLEAMVEAEYITEDEANLHEVRVGIEDFGTDQLLEELGRRAH